MTTLCRTKRLVGHQFTIHWHKCCHWPILFHFATLLIIYSTTLHSFRITNTMTTPLNCTETSSTDNTTNTIANSPLSQCTNDTLITTNNSEGTSTDNAPDRNVPIRLLYLLPCTNVLTLKGTTNESTYIEKSSKSQSNHWHTTVRDCDVLAYAATELAQERVNHKFAELQTEVELVPIGSDTAHSTIQDLSSDPINSLTVELIKHLEQSSTVRYGAPVTVFHGVIGPGRMGNSVSRRLTPIFQNMEWMQVSYSDVDSAVQRYNVYHQSIPPESTANSVRLNILENFYWPKFAIFTAEMHPYVEAAEHFEGIYWRNYGMKYSLNVAYSGHFLPDHTNDIKSGLTRMKELGIRVIVGFFGPKHAREILCTASSPEFGLTSSEHVWILPSYYDPDWWTLESYQSLVSKQPTHSNSSNCTDEEMMKALNSAIFVDAVKYPVLDLPMTEFYSQLINKTRRLFPSLSRDVDLSRYLQHSRATSAYDAVMLLFHSLRKARGNGTTHYSNTNPFKVALQLLGKTMACEQCRLQALCYNTTDGVEVDTPLDTLSSACHSFSMVNCNDITEVADKGLEGIDEFVRSNSYYGQILISQFVNGSHCPLYLCWPLPNIKSNNFSNCTQISRLNSLSSNGFVPHPGLSLVCPTTFWWKGRDSPPRGNVRILNSHISIASLIVVSITIAFGLLVAAAYVLFNLLYRKNVYVKASSPRLNLVIVFGCIIQMPIPLLYGLNYSSMEYSIPPHTVKVLCWFVQMVPVLGSTLIVSTMLVKNWRIYYIFHRKTRLAENVKFLSDNILLLLIFILTAPSLLAVIIYSIWVRMKYTEWMTFTNPDSNIDFTLVRITNCETSRDWKEDYVTLGLLYVLLLWFFNFLLALLNSKKSTTNIKRFRMEGKLSLNMATVAALPYPIFIISLIILLSFQPKSTNDIVTLPPPYHGIYWLLYCWLCVCPLLVLAVPLLVRIGLVMKRRKETKLSMDAERLAETFSKLKAEASMLRERLNKKEDAILEMIDKHNMATEEQLLSVSSDTDS